MPNPNKQKGNGYEREIVKEAEAHGFGAERAYASNGRALGEAEEVDVLIKTQRRNFRVQAKRRKKIASFLKIPEGADVVFVREDRGESQVIMPSSLFYEILQTIDAY